MVPFGQFRPDLYGLNGSATDLALNVLPGPDGYLPLPSLAVGSAAVATAVRGAFTARTSSNGIAIFVGTATKLYKYVDIATAWTDVTRLVGGDYALVGDTYWSFIQFGSYVIAFNGADNPQFIDVNSGTNFALLAGSPPKASYAAVIGDQIILADLAATDNRAVKLSGINDSAFWTAGQKRSTSQSFQDAGFVMGVAGFEKFGVVWQSEGVRRLVMRPDRLIFETYKIENARGTSAPYSIIPDGGGAVYYGSTGFAGIGSDGGAQAIGSTFLDGWFRETSAVATRPKAIIGARDPTRVRYFWLYASVGNTASTTLDRLLCYDPTLIESDYGPFTYAEVSATYLFPAASAGVSLDALYTSLGYAIDDVPYSLDADLWAGGAPALAAFNSANKLAFFTGPNMAATVQTPRFQPVPQKRFYVNGFRPLTDAANATGRIAVSERPQDSETWTASGTLNAQGVINFRASGRFMRAEVTVPAGETWTALQGIDMDDGLVMQDGDR